MKNELLEVYDGMIDILEEVRSEYPERVTTDKIVACGIAIPSHYPKEHYFPGCNASVCLKLFEKQMHRLVTEDGFLVKEQFANILYAKGNMIGIADAKCQLGILFKDPDHIREMDLIERMVTVDDTLQYLFSLQLEAYWDRLQEVVKNNIAEVTAILNIPVEMNPKTVLQKLQKYYQK